MASSSLPFCARLTFCDASQTEQEASCIAQTVSAGASRSASWPSPRMGVPAHYLPKLLAGRRSST
eukprot:2078027-Pyramimonas_sp.AAC.1